jgi:hypothetical protein
MSNEAQQSADDKKQMIDIYKIRIEEYDRNFLSLRDVEWRTAFQFLTGYVAVGLAFNQIKPSPETPVWWLPTVCIALVALLFGFFLYFRWRIQWRLWLARDRRQAFSRMLHEVQPATTLEAEANYPLRGTYWYTFITQVGIHSLAVATIVGFIVAKWFGKVQ